MGELILYQFPISHYCEKVRWALDHKGLEYQRVNLLPGLHMKKTRKLAENTSVPLLTHNKKAIQGSSEIITYLDEVFPEKSLSPDNQELFEEAIRLEKYADQEIGIHIRRICYHHLLQTPSQVISLFTKDGPWYGPLVMRAIFPGLKKKMRQVMKINEASSERSLKRLHKSVDKLHELLDGEDYIIGDSFTRVDMTFASLLAPFSRPVEHELDWPTPFLGELESIVMSFGNQLDWTNKIYAKHR
jgi:glutathione S-transferase